MAKTVKKKVSLKIIPVLIVLIVPVILYFLFTFVGNMKIENIVILGNSRLKDQEIIDLAGISNYPSFYRTSTVSMKRKVMASPYIKNVTVKRRFYHTIEIQVEEYNLLYKRASDNKVITEDGGEFLSSDTIYGLPILLNYIPDTKQASFQEGMKNTDENIRKQISEITYVPNEFDKDRFLLTMDDGNSVYLTLTKFEMLNYYQEVLPQLEGKKGILYFDSGNHFEIIE